MLVVLFCIISTTAAAITTPPLQAHVNDYAHVFSAEAITSLEQRLIAFEQHSQVQIALVTLNSLNGQDIESVAITIANKWGLGQKKLDNGLLILIAKESQEVRIEVGAGIEDKITDLRAGYIIDHIIVPNFKAKNFDQGIDAAIDSIIKYLDPTYVNNPDASAPDDAAIADNHYEYTREEIIFIVILLTIAICVWLYRKYRRAKNGEPDDSDVFLSSGSQGQGSGPKFTGGGGSFRGGGASGRW